MWLDSNMIPEYVTQEMENEILRGIELPRRNVTIDRIKILEGSEWISVDQTPKEFDPCLVPGDDSTPWDSQISSRIKAFGKILCNDSKSLLKPRRWVAKIIFISGCSCLIFSSFDISKLKSLKFISQNTGVNPNCITGMMFVTQVQAGMSSVEGWSVDEVASYLAKLELNTLVPIFKENAVVRKTGFTHFCSGLQLQGRFARHAHVTCSPSARPAERQRPAGVYR
jgi:hypothetical protein